MSCVWDGIRDAIKEDYKHCIHKETQILLSKQLESRHLPNFFVLNNKICNKVSVNGEYLSKQFLGECMKSIEKLYDYPIHIGYLCSTCDPLLILICQIFNVYIKHTHFNGTTSTYKNKDRGRTTYHFESSRTHFWYINK